MRPRPLLLTLLLASGAAWAQEVTVQSTTILRLWQEELPGMDKQSFAPGVQLLGIDATGLRGENLSLHLYGWGYHDFREETRMGRATDGDLSYGYLRYRFDKANAEIKAGRFTVAQGGGFEWIDGVSARADLRGGFTLSLFGGLPVWLRGQEDRLQKDYEYQRDFIAGARLAKRVAKVAEVGLSVLVDGTKPAHKLHQPSAYDYTRRHVGLDLRVMGPSGLDLNGRTVWDVADRPELLSGQEEPKRIAEHDYSLSWRFGDAVAVTAGFAERNFHAYYAGTTLPSLFRPDERGSFTSMNGKVVWTATEDVEVSADYRQADRESYGASDRFGGDLRWKISGKKLQAGFGYHRVSAPDVLLPSAKVAAFALSHTEVRAWAMYAKDKLSASLDAILHRFDDETNPALYGRSTEYEVVGSLGYQTTENLKVSADLSVGANPLYKHETRALFRVEYRFGFAAKGGSK